MKTFVCEDCKLVYGWVLAGFFWRKCAYCCGAYSDGRTRMPGKSKYYEKWKFWLNYYFSMLKK